MRVKAVDTAECPQKFRDYFHNFQAPLSTPYRIGLLSRIPNVSHSHTHQQRLHDSIPSFLAVFSGSIPRTVILQVVKFILQSHANTLPRVDDCHPSNKNAAHVAQSLSQASLLFSFFVSNFSFIQFVQILTAPNFDTANHVSLMCCPAPGDIWQ